MISKFFNQPLNHFGGDRVIEHCLLTRRHRAALELMAGIGAALAIVANCQWIGVNYQLRLRHIARDRTRARQASPSGEIHMFTESAVAAIATAFAISDIACGRKQLVERTSPC
jgi:hypothetical protein